MSERNRKKPLYTGDPNATATMCAKKLRRHEFSDLQYLIQPKDPETGQRAVIPFCRHCKQNPLIPEAVQQSQE